MTWTLFETKIGTCGLAWSESGITAVQLPEESVKATEKRLTTKLAAGEKATKKTTPAFATDAIARLRDHLSGKPQSFDDLPIDLRAVTEFNASIYEALRKIPSGKTITYGDLAKAAGSSVGASRAVGKAMGMNPVPVIIPCHRVTAAGGKPGGFSAYGGIVTKEKLLTLEGASLTTTNGRTPSLFATVEDVFPYDRQAALTHLRTNDSVLAAHLAKTGDFTLSLKGTESTFHALAEAIVYQQLNGKAAATIFGRVQDLFPKKRLNAERLLAIKDKDLRGAGLSKNKLAALRDLAERTSRGEIPTMKELALLDDDAIVEKLTKVRGIGRWTVEMLLIFRLGRPDVLPVADYGIKKGFARLFHRGAKREELPTDADMIRRAEKWRPFRSVASWYLWRATDAN